MYSIATTDGHKLVGKLEIVSDKVRGPDGYYPIRSIHSIWTKMLIIKTENGFISFPGFVDVKTSAGHISANKLIRGLKLSQYGVERRILRVSDAGKKLRVKRVSVPGPYYISGVEVRNT